MSVKTGLLALLEAKPGKGEEGRQAHLGGKIPEALGQVGPDLLAKDPDIRPVDVIAVK
jgi:hypothetical protein